MSTVHKAGHPNLYDREDWKISSRGLEMLRCFMSGVDDIIISIALDVARKRQGGTEPVRIDAAEIRQAADILFDHIRKQGDLPGLDVEGIDECLKAKCGDNG